MINIKFSPHYSLPDVDRFYDERMRLPFVPHKGMIMNGVIPGRSKKYYVCGEPEYTKGVCGPHNEEYEEVIVYLALNKADEGAWMNQRDSLACIVSELIDYSGQASDPMYPEIIGTLNSKFEIQFRKR